MRAVRAVRAVRAMRACHARMPRGRVHGYRLVRSPERACAHAYPCLCLWQSATVFLVNAKNLLGLILRWPQWLRQCVGKWMSADWLGTILERQQQPGWQRRRRQQRAGGIQVLGGREAALPEGDGGTDLLGYSSVTKPCD
eukprot:1880581-Pleurochrysis_carterae.AAC.2